MKTQGKGIIFSILGGVFWGISGVCGQYLFDRKGLNARWMVTVRLIIAGVLMLAIIYRKPENRKRIKDLFGKKEWLFRLLLFSIFGMAMCQLTYFSTIECSNASTATVLQYTSPVLIMIYVSIKNRKKPTKLDILALVLAVVGTFLLATHGNIGTLALSKETLLWGAGAAICVSLYNLLPTRLMQEFGIGAIMGWGMLIGGICMAPVTKPWIVPGTWDVTTFLGLAAVIVVGTILAFGVYFKGVQSIGEAKASLYASSEPLTATVATAVFMGVQFMPMDIAGLVCIVVGAAVLSIQKL
ncbi:MAG: DMT family transporter [Lachnospiraceae bacterium]|nr:DMT family transporter [Lachnospiraceae bacterium]